MLRGALCCHTSMASAFVHISSWSHNHFFLWHHSKVWLKESCLLWLDQNQSKADRVSARQWEAPRHIHTLFNMLFSISGKTWHFFPTFYQTLFLFKHCLFILKWTKWPDFSLSLFAHRFHLWRRAGPSTYGAWIAFSLCPGLTLFQSHFW